MATLFANTPISILSSIQKFAERSVVAKALASLLLIAPQSGCGLASNGETLDSIDQDPSLEINGNRAENTETALKFKVPCTYQPDGNIRCLDTYGMPAFVRITNKSTVYSVYLQEEEWHSRCGFPGIGAGWSRRAVRPGGQIDIDFRESSWATCREKFLISCALDGVPVRKCTDVLNAYMVVDP